MPGWRRIEYHIISESYHKIGIFENYKKSAGPHKIGRVVKNVTFNKIRPYRRKNGKKRQLAGIEKLLDDRRYLTAR